VQKDAGNLKKRYFLILVVTVTKQMRHCVINLISLFNESEGVMPDGKKLATYGQCQWDLTSVAISVFPLILS